MKPQLLFTDTTHQARKPRRRLAMAARPTLTKQQRAQLPIPGVVPPAPISETRRLPMLLAGRGELLDCINYESTGGCLDRWVRSRLTQQESDENYDDGPVHCPPGCRHQEQAPRYAMVALAHVGGNGGPVWPENYCIGHKRKKQ